MITLKWVYSDMRWFFSLILVIGITTNMAAQKAPEALFEMAKSTSSFEFDELVDFVDDQLTKEEDIARFFYYWIGQNIAYDFTTALVGLENGFSPKVTQPDYVMKYRKATCTGYTNLYNSFLGHFGILHRTVLGYSRHQSNLLEQVHPVLDHAWSALYLDSKWQLVDVSWTNGIINSPMMRDHYFLTDPKAFINDHLPVDEEWLLGAENLSLTDFERQPLINVIYYGLSQKPIIRPKFSKNTEGELVVELENIRGWNLKFWAVDLKSQKANKLKDKKKKTGSSIRFTLKNYEPGDLLRLDATRVGANHEVIQYNGLAYMAHPDWQWPKPEAFRQFSTKRNRH